LGNYYIRAIPDQSASLDEKFSIRFYIDDTFLTLTENNPISSIPEKPYTFEVTDRGIIKPIAIWITAYPTFAAPGTSINFTIKVTNTGTMPLNELQVVDRVPNGLSYISDNRSGAVSGRNITWDDLGYLDKGSIYLHPTRCEDRS
jgi:uncharacterized repeat protein (TIGR01451 family)